MSTPCSSGVRLAYDVEGAGEPLLLIQGLGYGRHGWGPAPGLLAERFQRRVFDNRGFGESDMPPGPYTTAQLAEDALARARRGRVERAHVSASASAGWSRRSSRSRRRSACASSCSARRRPAAPTAFPMPEQTVALMAARAAARPAGGAAPASSRTRSSPEPPAGLVDEIVAYRAANPPDGAGWYAQAARARRTTRLARLGEIRAPTLVVHGTADNVVDVAQRAAPRGRDPGARLELFEGVGHLLPGSGRRSSSRSSRSSSRERCTRSAAGSATARGGRRSASRSTTSAAR